jgi:hypothetical protein
MSARALGELLGSGVIERVEPDRAAADRELFVARRHITTAASVARSDPTGAFAVGYDAIRKAITAHMRASGYRTRKGPGHHARIGRYAVAAIDAPEVTGHLQGYDDLRLLRNQSQYEGLEVEPEEVDELIAHARAIVGAIRDDLGL